MTPLCHDGSSCINSVGSVVVGVRCRPSGTDQMMVLIGGLRWLPSLFQISQEFPERSVKMSGSMLPP